MDTSTGDTSSIIKHILHQHHFSTRSRFNTEHFSAKVSDERLTTLFGGFPQIWNLSCRPKDVTHFFNNNNCNTSLNSNIFKLHYILFPYFFSAFFFASQTSIRCWTELSCQATNRPRTRPPTCRSWVLEATSTQMRGKNLRIFSTKAFKSWKKHGPFSEGIFKAFAKDVFFLGLNFKIWVWCLFHPSLFQRICNGWKIIG